MPVPTVEKILNCKSITPEYLTNNNDDKQDSVKTPDIVLYEKFSKSLYKIRGADNELYYLIFKRMACAFNMARLPDISKKETSDADKVEYVIIELVDRYVKYNRGMVFKTRTFAEDIKWAFKNIISLCQKVTTKDVDTLVYNVIKTLYENIRLYGQEVVFSRKHIINFNGDIKDFFIIALEVTLFAIIDEIIPPLIYTFKTKIKPARRGRELFKEIFNIFYDECIHFKSMYDNVMLKHDLK